MKCLKCNNEINNNSKFCEYCGNRVESNINMTNNQIYNNTPNQNVMMNTNNNDMYNININNNPQTNNINYNNSNVNDIVNNNVTMNNTVQNNNSFNNNVSANINNNVVNNQLINNELNNNIINSNINSINTNIINSNIDNIQMENSNNNFSINNDFKTLEGATNLFKSVNCIGNQNLMFIAYKDPNAGPLITKKSFVGGILGGAVGGFVGGLAEGAERAQKEENMGNTIGIGHYDALLINVTENGLGFIPLLIEGSRIMAKHDRYVPNMNNYSFINNNYIESIVFKKYSFGGKTKKVTIKIQDNITFDLMACMEEKLVPYQKESMEKLVNMYSKK